MMPGVLRGKARNTTSVDCTPPVDTPITTTRSVVSAMAPWTAGGAMKGRGAGLPPAGAGAERGSAFRLALAAAFTASTKPLERSPKNSRRPMRGLVTKLTAPAARACMVVSQPASVSVEHMTTGVGRSAISLRKNVMPSMRGISTSRTITSGQALSSLGHANTGSWAVATTSIPPAVNKSDRCLRTTAESSMIIALIAMFSSPVFRRGDFRA